MMLSWLSSPINAQIVFPGSIEPEILTQLGRIDVDATGGNCLTRAQLPGSCMALSACLFDYTQLKDLMHQKPCLLSSNIYGVCCPLASTSSGVAADGTLRFQAPRDVPIPQLKAENFQRAADAAGDVFNDRVVFQEQLFEQKISVRPGTSAKFHQDLFRTSQQTLALGDKAIKNLETTIQLVNQLVVVVVVVVAVVVVVVVVVIDHCPIDPSINSFFYFFIYQLLTLIWFNSLGNCISFFLISKINNN